MKNEGDNNHLIPEQSAARRVPAVDSPARKAAQREALTEGMVWGGVGAVLGGIMGAVLKPSLLSDIFNVLDGFGSDAGDFPKKASTRAAFGAFILGGAGLLHGFVSKMGAFNIEERKSLLKAKYDTSSLKPNIMPVMEDEHAKRSEYRKRVLQEQGINKEGERFVR